MEKWTVLESKYLHRKEWLTIREDRCRMANGGEIPAFYVNEYSDWVNAFGITKEGKVLMVRQYRHGIGSIETELPGGVSEEGETMEEACRREVLEETGYTFGNWKFLGKISANPSTTNNFMHMFLATGGTRTAEQNLDDSEELEVVELSIDEVKALVRENKMAQSLHVNCILYALIELGELQF
ncbi:MAG: NUDIX hydrolase [Chitinophagaceae bacterium]|nr:MAG: NUDIX hydrolase [Chitinophagaceae bacterium]